MREPRRPFTKIVKRMFLETPIIGAEIGVGAGWNAVEMLITLPNLKLLYLIDPHEKYNGYVDLVAKEMLEVTWKDLATKRLERFGDRKKWVRKRFEHCTLEDIPNKLDFIYIDGNHKYDYVKQDIEHSFNFLKKGTVLGGHDYTFPIYAEDVSAAVRDYCNEHGIGHYYAKNDWWFYT